MDQWNQAQWGPWGPGTVGGDPRPDTSHLPVLQLGFITVFVVAFPLASPFALLNNWAEVQLDAHKLMCEYW